MTRKEDAVKSNAESPIHDDLSWWNRIVLGARTLRPLTLRQLVYLPIRKVQLHMAPPVVQTGDPQLRDLESFAAAVASWGPAASEYRRSAEQTVRGDFAFLGRVLRLSHVEWRRRYISQLWSYNLHYFDYARDLAWAFRETGNLTYRDRFVHLASTWVEDAAGRPTDGWHPYVLSTRIVNWAYALLLFDDAIGAEQRRVLWSSVHTQLCVLERRIEWHLRANHLQRNLQALALGAMLFEDPDAARWKRRWVPALWSEIEEQVLHDGVHFERSPMYHAIAFADLLETVSLATAVHVPVPEYVIRRLSAMSDATGVLFRPTGNPHLFNDCASDVAPPLAYLDRLSSLVLGQTVPRHSGTIELHAAGYYGICGIGVHADRLVIDCGEPGPRYQPGHGHCDMLSFELDVGGTPFATDSGVCGYADDPLREYARSTRAHNTVAVGDGEQHELWGVFRIARRAQVEEARQHAGPGGEYHFHGSYRPYYSRKIRHSRKISCSTSDRSSVYTITDVVDGAHGAPLRTFLHLHPSMSVECEELAAMAAAGAVSVEIEFFGVDSLEVQRGVTLPRAQGWYCATFGSSTPAPCLVASVGRNSGRPFGYRLRVTSRQ